MRKIEKILLLILLTSVIVTPTFAKSDYQVTTGQTFKYDIHNAFIEVTRGTNYASGNGYMIDYQPFAAGTTITVEVTSVDPPNGVNFVIKGGGESETGVSTVLGDLVGISIFMSYPMWLFDGFGNMAWNLLYSAIIKGTGLIIIPFWDVDYLYGFENMANPASISQLTTDPIFQGVTIQSNYEEKDGNMILDWYLIGSITATTPYSLDFEVLHQWKLVYDLTTGVLQGMRITCSAAGTHTGTELELSMDYHIELNGYKLEDYVFGPGTPVPGFGWAITLIILGVLAVPVIMRKSRKYARF
jgi:hypothetical protein